MSERFEGASMAMVYRKSIPCGVFLGFVENHGLRGFFFFLEIVNLG